MSRGVVTTTAECIEACRAAAARGRSIALVPTMGYLHEGHRTLLREGRGRAEYLVATIFVNPTQFGPGEDLDRYPRNLEGDVSACEDEGVDLVFAPGSPGELYPDGYQTHVEVESVTRHFCGASRPGHFRGVATVVTKLFNIVRPAVALFGEKDFQQLVTIRRLARDLELGVEIAGVPTVREDDGLALSSRNAYLEGGGARRRARCLFEGLTAAQRAFARGERRAGAVRDEARSIVEDAADAVDYVDLAHPEVLEPLSSDASVDADTRLLIAAFFDGGRGRTRLIDNGRLGGERGF